VPQATVDCPHRRPIGRIGQRLHHLSLDGESSIAPRLNSRQMRAAVTAIWRAAMVS
jgi:hypothetical protein